MLVNSGVRRFGPADLLVQGHLVVEPIVGDVAPKLGGLPCPDAVTKDGR